MLDLSIRKKVVIAQSIILAESCLEIQDNVSKYWRHLRTECLNLGQHKHWKMLSRFFSLFLHLVYVVHFPSTLYTCCKVVHLDLSQISEVRGRYHAFRVYY